MLAYLLSLTVALGSLAIYLSAFLFPEIHRKNDFIWSGVGFFYGLVLWIFAPRITGGLLLGHLASVSLLVWFGWQTLSLRRQLIPEVQQTPLPSPALMKMTFQETISKFQETISKFSVPEKWSKLQGFIGNVVGAVKGKIQEKASKSPSAPVENIENSGEVVISDLSTVQEVTSVEEVGEVSLSLESDIQPEITPTVEEVLEVSLSTESDVRLETTIEVVNSDLSVVVEVAPVQEVVKVNEPESAKVDTQLETEQVISTEESAPEQIPLNKPTSEE